MKRTDYRARINRAIKELNDEQHRQLLEFIDSMLSGGKAFSGKRLASFAGKIDKDDLRRMEKAIEDGCEKVNPNEW